MDIKIFGIVKESITDGYGLRYVLFTQGCKHDCKGCHNPDSHSFENGYTMTVDDIIKELKTNSLIDGITLSGGDPFYQPIAILKLVKQIRNELKHLNIWAYTGFTFEELLKDKNRAEILNYVDVLVDGRYEEQLRSLELSFKGSTNQRIIDVKKTLETKQITLYKG